MDVADTVTVIDARFSPRTQQIAHYLSLELAETVYDVRLLYSHSLFHSVHFSHLSHFSASVQSFEASVAGRVRLTPTLPFTARPIPPFRGAPPASQPTNSPTQQMQQCRSIPCSRSHTKYDDEVTLSVFYFSNTFRSSFTREIGYGTSRQGLSRCS